MQTVPGSGDRRQDPYGDAPLIGALLRMSLDALLARMREGLAARGFDDLPAEYLVVLQYPGPDGLRPTELAARTRMTRQALNYLLGQMEGRGYVAREPDPESRRSRRLRLTPRGADAVLAIREVVRETEAEWTATLGAERLEQLRALLTDVVAATASPSPTGP